MHKRSLWGKFIVTNSYIKKKGLKHCKFGKEQVNQQTKCIPSSKKESKIKADEGD